MRKMMTALMVVGFLLSYQPARAEIRFAVGPDIVLPVGEFGDVAGGGIGVHMEFTSPLKPRVDLLGEIGFNAYGGVTVADTEFSWTGVPVAVGARYAASSTAFLQGKVGMVIKRGEISSTEFSGTDSDTGWLLAPGAGMHFGRFSVLGEFGIGSNSWRWFGVKGSYRFGDKPE